MEFNKKVMSSGLTVLHEKRDVQVTTVMLAAKYGAAYETAEEKGISHFMEHLCFKGTPTRTTREISAELENLGGMPNAFTSEEVTAYYVKLPSVHLKTAMDVIFDIYFNATFPEIELKKESQVILEEMKMYRDNPRAHVMDKIKTELYAEPFGISIIGTEKTIKSTTREKIYEKHKEMYSPKNSILCVVGNNSFEEVLELAEKLTIKSDGETPKVQTIELKNSKMDEKRNGLGQTNVAIGFHFPFENKSGRFAGEIFSTILGSGMSSRLFTEVREKRGLVYSIKSMLDLGKNFGYLMIVAGTDPSKTDEVKKICLEEYSKMENITEQELKDAKIQLIGNRSVDNEGSSEVAVGLVLEEINGDANNYYNFEKNINEVTLDQVKELSKKVDHSIFTLGP
ncbi:MAG: insulinase family protein [Nanoarchaeota archaeon]|nr:insulinase family protein [Nanoarchaeota archaeon]